MISVIMPVYNRENTVTDAVNSVLGQTYSDLELIIVDDGSDDRSKERISSIHDTRLRYVYEANSGACAARNAGIDLARGDYIAFHDSDDMWHADKLEKEYQALIENKADLVFCKLVRNDPDGKKVFLPEHMENGFLSPVRNLFGIGTQTLLGRKEVFDDCRFDTSMPRFQEFELLLRISEKYSIYCLDEGLVDYYIGTDSVSSNPDKLLAACEMIMAKYPSLKTKYPEMVRIMASALRNTGIELKKKKDPRAVALIRKSMEYDASLSGKMKYLWRSFFG